MEKMFFLGLAIGMIGGALVVANNYKARCLVKRGQQEVLDRVDEMLDEKLKAMDEKKEENNSFANE